MSVNLLDLISRTCVPAMSLQGVTRRPHGPLAVASAWNDLPDAP